MGTESKRIKRWLVGSGGGYVDVRLEEVEVWRRGDVETVKPIGGTGIVIGPKPWWRFFLPWVFMVQSRGQLEDLVEMVGEYANEGESHGR